MKREKKSIVYNVYADPAELTEADRELWDAAVAALKNSWSPYSEFKVAAALRMRSGKIITGSNQENAAYPMCLCAERVALAAAASVAPGEEVESMFITVRNAAKPVTSPAAPCGACRQVLCETETRQATPLRLLLRGEEGEILEFEDSKTLLPWSFSGAFL